MAAGYGAEPGAAGFPGSDPATEPGTELAAELAAERATVQRQRDRIAELTEALRRTQTGRWARLGLVLAERRRGPGALLRIPANLVRVLRDRPVKSPPVRPVPWAGPVRPTGPSSREGPAGGRRGAGGRGMVGGGGTGGGRAAVGRAGARVAPPYGRAGIRPGPGAPAPRAVAVLDPALAEALAFEWHDLGDRWPDGGTVQRATGPAAAAPAPAGSAVAGPPDLVFVQSVAPDHPWYPELAGERAPGPRLRAVLARAAEQGVPTAFWYTGAPPGLGGYAASARLFDRVFTVHPEGLAACRDALGHDRVGVLPHAVQPRSHNPVAVPGGRLYEAGYAGGPPTAAGPAGCPFPGVPATELTTGLAGAAGGCPGRPDPAEYKRYQLFLAPPAAPGGHCPREVFEAAASGTPILAPTGSAAAAVFGDRVLTAPGPGQARVLVDCLLGSRELRDRQAHLALREVLSRHTYRHRVAEVLAALGRPDQRTGPAVSVLLATRRPAQLSFAIEQIAAQAYRPLQLVLVPHGFAGDRPGLVDQATALARAAGLDDVVVRPADAALTLGGCLNLAVAAAEGELMAKMDDDDLYGPHHIADLVAAFSYTDAGVVGRLAHYVHLRSTGANLLRFPGSEHAYVNRVMGATMLARAELMRRFGFDDVSGGEDTRFLRRCRDSGARLYAAGRYGFVAVRGAAPDQHTWRISEVELLRSGRVDFFGPPERHVLI